MLEKGSKEIASAYVHVRTCIELVRSLGCVKTTSISFGPWFPLWKGRRQQYSGFRSKLERVVKVRNLKKYIYIYDRWCVDVTSYIL